jgi:diguanylate cyclase (GGDEF)-like protein
VQNWESGISNALRALKVESIRRKIVVFAALATLIPSVSTAVLSYVYNRRALTQKVTETLRSTSSQGAREVDIWMKERTYDVRVFASSYEVSENVDRVHRGGQAATALSRLRDYLSSVKERFADYQELIVIDRDGHFVASSAPKPGPAPRLSGDWVLQMRTRDAIVGDVYWDSTSGRPMVALGVPITTTDGRFLGALAAKLSLMPVVSSLHTLALERSGTLDLVTLHGQLLASSAGATAALLDQSVTRATLDQLTASNQQVVPYTSRQGVAVLGALAPIERLDWAVVASVPLAEAYAAIARLRGLTVLTVATLLLVIGALAYLLGLTIVLPLDRLARGAREVAGGDLTAAVPVVGAGEVAYVTEVFNDMVARLRQGREELERLSRTDGLTELPNRRHLMETLEREIRRAKRNQHPFTLLMIDVDHFKQFNDAFGHLAGDEVLKRLAGVLTGAIRTADYAGRFGGEEFTVLLPETPLDGADEVAERIRGRMAEQTFGDGRPPVTLSIGMGECPTDGDSVDTIIECADAALYRAKEAGRNRVVTTKQLRRQVSGDVRRLVSAEAPPTPPPDPASPPTRKARSRKND